MTAMSTTKRVQAAALAVAWAALLGAAGAAQASSAPFFQIVCPTSSDCADDTHEAGPPLPFTKNDLIAGWDSGYVAVVGSGPNVRIDLTYKGSDALWFNLFRVHDPTDPSVILAEWWNQDPTNPGGPGALPGIVATPDVTTLSLTLPSNTLIPYDFIVYPSGQAGGDPSDPFLLCNDSTTAGSTNSHSGVPGDPGTCGSGNFTGVVGSTQYNNAHIFVATVDNDSELLDLTSPFPTQGTRAWIGLSDGGFRGPGVENDGKDHVVLATIPEPGSLALTGVALAALALRLRRRS